MKRNILAVSLLIIAFFCVFGQNNEPIDLVLVLNTSSAMGSSYENVNNYITGSFLSEFLNVGDTFHLVTFSASPKLEIARRISQIGDVETIIGRMLIQFPVESGNNPAAAISFAEQYVDTLPLRPKKIVLVSTGSSDIAGLIDAASVRLRAKNITLDYVQVTPGQALTNLPSSRRSSAGRTATPSSSTPSAASPSTSAVATGTTITTNTTGTASTATSTTTTTTTDTTSSITGTTTTTTTTTSTPDTATTTAITTTQPAVSTQETSTETQQITNTGTTDTATTVTNITQPDASTQETSTTLQTTDVIRIDSSTESQTQDSTQAGSTTQTTATETTSTTQQTATTAPPPRQRDTPTGTTGIGSWSSSIWVIIGIILLLLVLGLIIFFASRRIGSRGSGKTIKSSPPSQASPPSQTSKEELPPLADHSKNFAKYAALQNRQRSSPYSDRPLKPDSDKPVVINPTGPLLLNLFVEDQNTAIGKRNIHSLKSGYSLSVGGGKSDYLIFLVPFPSNIGEIRRNGSQLTFIPRKRIYFPDLGGNELRDCINKTIRIVSDRNYELRFRFEMYEDPLVALNKILHSIKVPG